MQVNPSGKGLAHRCAFTNNDLCLHSSPSSQTNHLWSQYTSLVTGLSPEPYPHTHHTPAQRLQMTTQRLMEAQSGWAAPQSAQNLLGATAQMRSATSEVDRASAMAPCMASSHCSFSISDSAKKLGTQKWEEM